MEQSYQPIFEYTAEQGLVQLAGLLHGDTFCFSDGGATIWQKGSMDSSDSAGLATHLCQRLIDGKSLYIFTDLLVHPVRVVFRLADKEK